MNDAVTFRKTVLLVAVLNGGYFFVEFRIARWIGSVSLFADSIDFLEDTSVNLLIFAAIGWSARARARVGMVFAGILLVPVVATAWTVWEKLPAPPAPGGNAFARGRGGADREPLVRADVGAVPRTLRQPGAGGVSLGAERCPGECRNPPRRRRDDLSRERMGDLIVGVGIAIMNLDAAGEVFTAARGEARVARP